MQARQAWVLDRSDRCLRRSAPSYSRMRLHCAAAGPRLARRAAQWSPAADSPKWRGEVQGVTGMGKTLEKHGHQPAALRRPAAAWAPGVVVAAAKVVAHWPGQVIISSLSQPVSWRSSALLLLLLSQRKKRECSSYPGHTVGVVYRPPTRARARGGSRPSCPAGPVACPGLQRCRVTLAALAHSCTGVTLTRQSSRSDVRLHLLC